MKSYKVILILKSGYVGISLFRTKKEARDFLKRYILVNTVKTVKVLELTVKEKEIEL